MLFQKTLGFKVFGTKCHIHKAITVVVGYGLAHIATKYCLMSRIAICSRDLRLANIEDCKVRKLHLGVHVENS